MSSIVYADTNIFMRYLTNEPVHLSDKVSKFFKELESGKYKLFVCDLVVSELVYVLENVVEMPKKEICEKVKILMIKNNIILENTQIIFKALDIYRDLNVNFVDAYIYCHSTKNGVKKYFSFGNHFKKFKDIELI